MRRQREERQHAARINGGIDWSVCLVPNCGAEFQTSYRAPATRDHNSALPLCVHHLFVAWSRAASVANEDHSFAVEALARVIDYRMATDDAAADAEKAKHAARVDGDIYFVRIGSMVKVGWTRALRQRIKSYGASAELLVSYPGTRSDETNLHRQLRPALAKGREWYEDGPIISSFIDEALAKYGLPPTFDTMWTKPKRVVAGKRAGK